MSLGVTSEGFQNWVGRTQSAQEIAAFGPVQGLAALLDHAEPPWPAGQLPPLAHWLYFLPRALQRLLDEDGHPRRGDFLPPVGLPRRMWVGSRIQFHAPILLGTVMQRRSTIANVRAKQGKQGSLVFVTVKHTVAVGSTIAISEEQDIAYRSAVTAGAKPEAPAPDTLMPQFQSIRAFTPDPARLFRFSALTFNSHRIHYDRDYARDVEGYAGLVVQGPYIATLLMDHFLLSTPGAQPREFNFRAIRPLLDTEPFDLCLAAAEGSTELSARRRDGITAFTANGVWT